MVESSLYKRLCDQIEDHHDVSIYEVAEENLNDRQKIFYGSLGTFIEHLPQAQAVWGRYSIYIRSDLPESEDEDKVIAALAHEFGHFICCSWIYPKLPVVGRYITRKLFERHPYTYFSSWDYMTRLITVVEELGAWIIGWGLLKKFKALSLQHVKYGLQCWSHYWHYLKLW
jgi:hypothetical protein